MKTSIKIIHWLPRFIGIVAILFISLFALDSFNPELTIWQQITGFLMHLIPSFILLILLLIAWKWEYVGGIIFTIMGLGLSPFVFIKNYEMNNSIWTSFIVILAITFPFVLVGILFIFSHFIKKRNKVAKEN
jgi:cytochrome b561